MLAVLGFVLVSIGLSLCMVVVKDAFRRSWRHGVLVLVFLPVTAPLYVFRGYSGQRFSLGLGLAMTLGLGSVSLLAVYAVAMQSTSSLRQFAAEQGYELKLRGLNYSEGIYTYTLMSSGAVRVQGPLLDREQAVAHGRVFVNSVLNPYIDRLQSSGADEPSQGKMFWVKLVLYVSPNAVLELLVSSDGEVAEKVGVYIRSTQ